MAGADTSPSWLSMIDGPGMLVIADYNWIVTFAYQWYAMRSISTGSGASKTAHRRCIAKDDCPDKDSELFTLLEQ